MAIYYPHQSPLIGIENVPTDVMSELWEFYDETSSNLSSENDGQRFLYANIENQPYGHNEFFETKKILLEFIIENSFVHYKEHLKNSFIFPHSFDEEVFPSFHSYWFVDMKPGEFNPLHKHPDTHINGIIWMEVIDKTLEPISAGKDLNVEKPTVLVLKDNSLIKKNSPLHNGDLLIEQLHFEPKKNDCLIMGGHVGHAVYPFCSEKNKRISFQWNINFMTKQQKEMKEKQSS